jgi:hypothetical protein
MLGLRVVIAALEMEDSSYFDSSKAVLWMEFEK